MCVSFARSLFLSNCVGGVIFHVLVLIYSHLAVISYSEKNIYMKNTDIKV